MARKRMIAPSIWTDEEFTDLPYGARLLYIGCFSNADDAGRLKASPRFLRLTIFPADKLTDAQVMAWRNLVSQKRKIRLYADDDGQELLDLPKWKQWQTIKRPQPSHLPSFTKEREIQFPTSGEPVGNSSSTCYPQISRSEVRLDKNNTTLGRAESTLPVGEVFEFWDQTLAVSPKDLREWTAAYPAVDVIVCVRAAAAWAAANPTRRKRNIRRFVVNWLAREQERGGTRRTVPELPKRESPYLPPPPVVAVPAPELTDEQRAENLRRLNAMGKSAGLGTVVS